MKQVFLIWTIPGLITMIRSTPAEIKTLGFMAFVLICSDMLLGVIAAFVCKEFRSDKMRNKWVLKLCAYFAMLCLAYCLTIITGYWQVVALCYTGVLSIEGGSITEKLVKIQILGGIDLGILSKFIYAIAPYYDIVTKNLPGGQTVVRHIAVMPNDPKEPEIHTTEIETAVLRRPDTGIPHNKEEADAIKNAT